MLKRLEDLDSLSITERVMRLFEGCPETLIARRGTWLQQQRHQEDILETYTVLWTVYSNGDYGDFGEEDFMMYLNSCWFGLTEASMEAFKALL